MLFSPRIRLKELAALCGRLSTALEAGIPIKTIWQRESGGYQRPALTYRMNIIREHISAGHPVADGLGATGDFFPQLFREMVDVGEETGRLPEVFRQLAHHYQMQVKLRREFLAAITWPMVQLVISLGVIGLVILVLGMIAPMSGGEPVDILGLGLVGPSGFAIYVSIVAAVFAGIGLLIQAMRRGAFWAKPIQKLVMQIPILGHSLQTMALSRLAWTLYVTLETGMALKKALRLSLRSTHSARYTDDTEQIVRSVMAGEEISEALAETRKYPNDFLDTLQVGEQTGRIPESMATLSRQYQEKAQAALRVMTQLAAFGVWALVAVFIIIIIFRFAFFYLNTINDALKM